MGKKLIITRLYDRIVSSVYEDFLMTEVNISEGNTYSLNNIYVGRVENVIKNINCAFIEIAKGVKCYYSLDDNKNHIFLNHKNTDKVNIGDLLLVQISKEGIKSKLPSLTSNINLPGKYVVLVKDGADIMISNKIKNTERIGELKELLSSVIHNFSLPCGFIVRTNGEQAENQDILQEALRLRDIFEAIIKAAPYRSMFTLLYSDSPAYIRDIINIKSDDLEEILTDDTSLYNEIKQFFQDNYPDEFEKMHFYEDPLLSLPKLYNIEGSIRNALRKKVWLKSGGYLVIEPTEALTVIDVNTGKFSENKKAREDTFLKINLEAAYEISLQMRLRNLSGIILIDFINLSEETNNELLLHTLKGYCDRDPVSTTLVDMTRLGLVEITRKKIKKPLHEMCSDFLV